MVNCCHPQTLWQGALFGQRSSLHNGEDRILWIATPNDR